MLEENPNLPAVVSGGRAITVMPDAQPMSIEAYRQRRELMKEAVGDMEENVDYGRIPGTSDLSLWEPGAEALRFTFNIQFKNECLFEVEDFKTHLYQYRYKCTQLLGPGIEGPSWEAYGSSRERKFWCKGQNRKKTVQDPCPNPCDGEHPPKGMEAAMLPHNVRDRVQKRAFVAMIRNVTGATGLFKGAGVDRYDAREDMADDEDFVAGGNDHPWLVTCPVHQEKWFKKGQMPQPGHRKDNDTAWCNQSDALKPFLDKEVKELAVNWNNKALSEWLKVNFGGTWSQLSAKQQLDAIEKLKTTVPPGSETQDQPDAEAPSSEAVPPENQGPPPDIDGAPQENQGAMEGMAPEN